MDYFFIMAVLICSIIILAGIKVSVWFFDYWQRKLTKTIDAKLPPMYLDVSKLDVYELRVLPNEYNSSRMYTYQIIVNNHVVFMTMLNDYYVGVTIKHEDGRWWPLDWHHSFTTNNILQPGTKVAVTFQCLRISKILNPHGKESGSVG